MNHEEYICLNSSNIYFKVETSSSGASHTVVRRFLLVRFVKRLLIQGLRHLVNTKSGLAYIV